MMGFLTNTLPRPVPAMPEMVGVRGTGDLGDLG